MNFSYRLPLALFSASVLFVMPQASVALPSTEVGAIAEQITVRIDGPDSGSGVIIDRQENIYTVVTNCHVVELAGTYTVQTQDKQQHFINNNQIKCLGDQVDLAVLRFASSQHYNVAKLGNSGGLRQGTRVYVAGWTIANSNAERELRFTDGQISGLSAPKQGYSLIYSNLAQPGMSGGPVLDEKGRVVGINGRAIPIPATGGVEFSGIPSNTLVEEAVNEGISLQLVLKEEPSQIPLSMSTSSLNTTPSQTLENPYGFTFNTPGAYADCLQDILLLYEDQKKFKRQRRQSNCLPQIFEKYADLGLSWTLAQRLIEAANSYATNPPLSVKLFPPGGLRSRIYDIFGLIYEVDVDATGGKVKSQKLFSSLYYIPSKR